MTLQKILAALCLVLLWGCGPNPKGVAEKFFKDNKLSNNPGKVLHAHSQPLLNRDYSNLAYFFVIEASRAEFERFVSANRFQKKEICALPTKENKWPEVPPWWDPPPDQAEKHCMDAGRTQIAIAWASGKMFLYAND